MGASFGSISEMKYAWADSFRSEVAVHPPFEQEISWDRHAASKASIGWTAQSTPGALDGWLLPAVQLGPQ